VAQGFGSSVRFYSPTQKLVPKQKKSRSCQPNTLEEFWTPEDEGS